MAVLYRPIENVFKDLYNIEDYISSETYRKELEDMPLDIVLGSLVFLQFKRIIESYEGLFQSGDNRNATFGGFLAKNGTGIKAFIQSLEACLNFQKQQASIYILS
jgi:hypothetical protein